MWLSRRRRWQRNHGALGTNPIRTHHSQVPPTPDEFCSSASLHTERGGSVSERPDRTERRSLPYPSAPQRRKSTGCQKIISLASTISETWSRRAPEIRLVASAAWVRPSRRRRTFRLSSIGTKPAFGRISPRVASRRRGARSRHSESPLELGHLPCELARGVVERFAGSLRDDEGGLSATLFRARSAS